MKLLKIVLPALSFALMISSCSKTAKQGKMIPKEAAIVVVVNTKSLTSKVSWEDVKQSSWFKAKYNDSSTTSWNKQMMDSPALSGIDMNGDQVFFVLKNGMQGEVVYVGDVKDSKTFEAFNKRIDSSATSVKDGNLNFLKLKNKAVLGWNDSKFVYVVNSTMGQNIMPQEIDDSLKQPAIPVNTDNLMPLCKRIFSLNTDSSLAKDEKFASLVKEEGDAHLWINVEQLTKNNPALGMLGMLKLDKFFDGNIGTATLNFENGKITVKQRNYTGKELSDLLKKYSGGSVNSDMLKNLPSANLAVAMAFHFKPEALLEILKLAGVDGMLNMAMSQAGLSVDDFIKANKGDLVFSLSDVKMNSDSTTDKYNDTTSIKFIQKPDMSVVFAVAIGDKDAFEKLMNAAKKMTAGKPVKDVVFKNTGQYLVIGNSQKSVDNFITGNKTAPAFADKVKDHSLVGFVDIQMLMKAFQPTIHDTTHKKMFDLNLALWDNIYMYGGDYDNGAASTTFEINLIDKSTNSLKQLNKFFDQAYPLGNHHWKKDMESMTADTTVTVQ